MQPFDTAAPSSSWSCLLHLRACLLCLWQPRGRLRNGQLYPSTEVGAAGRRVAELVSSASLINASRHAPADERPGRASSWGPIETLGPVVTDHLPWHAQLHLVEQLQVAHYQPSYSSRCKLALLCRWTARLGIYELVLAQAETSVLTPTQATISNRLSL